jgi:hypothetical protein
VARQLAKTDKKVTLRADDAFTGTVDVLAYPPGATRS